jgi:electron-transferring-flavoprotein dehydrogenase
MKPMAKSTAKRLGYGARAINASGINALPKTVFPGGALVG